MIKYNTENAASPRVLAAFEDLLVVDKPEGWSCHPNPQDPAPDLVGWLRAQGRRGAGAPAHRLDKHTSGLVLFGLTPAARAALGADLAEGRVEKRYLALVRGHVHAKGVVRRPLADGRRGRPLEAVTRYRLVEALGPWSLVELRPETGRKHQLRRHMQGLGHPIAGDARYGGSLPPAGPARLWLHARSLALPDGRRFESPLPPELAASLDALRAR